MAVAMETYVSSIYARIIVHYKSCLLHLKTGVLNLKSLIRIRKPDL